MSTVWCIGSLVAIWVAETLETFAEIRTGWGGLTYVLYGNGGAVSVAGAGNAIACGVTERGVGGLIAIRVGETMEAFSKIRSSGGLAEIQCRVDVAVAIDGAGNAWTSGVTVGSCG